MLVGRTTSAADDQTPELTREGDAYVARLSLGHGLWTVRLAATDRDGTAFEQRLSLRVR